jgi:2-hydroxy-6-oxonona-2,4-dienedioate hydrolase
MENLKHSSPLAVKKIRYGSQKIRTKWENLDGRRVRLWIVYPAGGTWPDADTCPPILLLHGLGCSVEAWKPTLLYLADLELNRPIYAMDMPGYGRSQGPREAMGIEQMADWTTRLMDQLGIPRAHIGGNSLGCQVALALARRHPARVGAIVLGGATDGNDIVPLWRSAAGLVLDAITEPLTYTLTLLRMYFQMGVPRYFATVRKMVEDDPLIHANRVSAPCLIVRGTRDGIVPERAARALAEALPLGAFHPLERAAHAVQFNSPEAFARIALAFWGQSDSLLCAATSRDAL